MFVHLQHFAMALIAQAAEQAPAQRGCMDNNALFLPIVMMAILYFVWIVPERKKHKTHQAMVENLKRGDEVITATGMFGTITNITDKTFELEIAKNVKIKILRSAVSRRVDPKAEEKADAKGEKADKADKAEKADKADKADAKSDAKSESKSKES